MTASPEPSPEPASVAELLRLAEEYRSAALALLAGRSTPGRFCALHAIELYLDAFLRLAGQSPARLRRHGHNFGARAALAIHGGLDLRRKTALHLVSLSRRRDYLAVRYGPKTGSEPCEINRLAGTLEEVAKAVRAAVAGTGAERGAA